MCSIKIVLENAHGQQQTFTRSLEAAGDISAAACLRDLRSLVGEVQTELNAALTRQVDDKRSAEKGKGKHPAATGVFTSCCRKVFCNFVKTKTTLHGMFE